jgi:hypothetical protein
MKITLNEFELFINDISDRRFLVSEGSTVILKYEVFTLSDLGDCYLQEQGSVVKEEGNVNLIRLSTRGIVSTLFGKKRLITKDFSKATMYGRTIDQLIGMPFDRDLLSSERRIWRSKLNRSMSETKENMNFHLCRGVDGVWFLYK